LSSEETLFRDSKLFNPSLVVAMPHLWNRLYYKENLDEYPLGNRIQIVATGGSFISPEVFDFLKLKFQNSIVLNAYGSTEAPGISTNGILSEGCLLRLKDIPELDYYSNDKPYPRGEICVKVNINSQFIKR
jgi:long-subunit acyl-CoA synthetase (AMP-forming)